VLLLSLQQGERLSVEGDAALLVRLGASLPGPATALADAGSNAEHTTALIPRLSVRTDGERAVIGP
jgi:hypothetical protein